MLHRSLSFMVLGLTAVFLVRLGESSSTDKQQLRGRGLLQTLGTSGDGSECQGDCNSNSDCGTGLNCFQRSSSTEAPPGCQGATSGSTDYCFDPTKYPPTTTLTRVDHRFSRPYHFKECYGDCDYDSDCDGNLLCYKRRSSDLGPPGCSGFVNGGTDYCFDPLKVGNNGHSTSLMRVDNHYSSPWGECLGDCDSDQDCQGGLRCFFRGSSDIGPPGCSGTPESGDDYCWDPSHISDSTVLTYISPNSSNGPWPKCHGDCDDDNDCQGTLVCYKRGSGSTAPIPGCSGEGVAGADYCSGAGATTSPTTRPITGSPTVTPTAAPTMKPTVTPTSSPDNSPKPPTTSPSKGPTDSPTPSPTKNPTMSPTTASPTQTLTSQVSIVDGMDWSLPTSVGFVPYAGLHEMSGTPPASNEVGGLVNCHGFTAYWSEISTAEGVYNFSSVNNEIDAIKATGRNCVVMRLSCSVVDCKTQWGTGPVPFIPQWVLDKCSPTEFYTEGSSPSSSKYIKVAAPWDQCVQQEYQEFARQVASANGPLSNPAVVGIYVHGISTSSGEEMSFDDGGRDNGVAAGMTPQNLGDAFKYRIQAWVNATTEAGHPEWIKRLVWVRFGYISPSGTWGHLRKEVDDVARGAGMGGRSGGNENWKGIFYRAMRSTPSYDAEYIAYDHSTGEAALADEGTVMSERRSGVFSGSEIEQYSTSSQGTGTHEFFLSLFMDNFIETKFAWIRNDPTFVSSVGLDFLEWWRKTTGIARASRPDAICMMLETYINTNSNGCKVLNNMGMGLRQTNIAQTPRALETGRSGQSRDCGDSSGGKDWIARRTDVAQNIKKFDFELLGPSVGTSPWNQGWMDDAMVTGENLCVLVNYIRSGAPDFQLVNSAGQVVGQAISADGGSAATRTASFKLPVTDLGRTFSVKTVSSTSDLHVKFVRVVRNCV